MEQKAYKKLEQVAVKYKQLTLYNIKPSSYYKAPFDTGNMFKKVDTYNTVAKMIKTKSSPYIISIQYAPQGAEYGIYVHNGTSRMRSRPFAKDAANSNDLNPFIDSFIEEIMGEQVSYWSEEIDRRIINKVDESDRSITITVI